MELAGTAKATSAAIVDPVYAKPCCYFRLKVEEYQSNGKSSNWVTIHNSDSDNRPFLCRDSTGDVLIMPLKPKVHFSHRVVGRSGFFGTKDAAIVSFLKSRWNTWSSLRLTLDVLREGDPVFVVGCAMSPRTANIPHSDASGPVLLSEAARQLKENSQAMKALDLNNDGEIDSQEWEHGLEKYRLFLEAKRRGSASAALPTPSPVTFDGIVTKTTEHDMILANSEKDLLSKLGPMSYLQILGGGAGLVFALVLLISRFGH